MSRLIPVLTGNSCDESYGIDMGTVNPRAYGEQPIMATVTRMRRG